MKFNPKSKLDASQIDDRRGQRVQRTPPTSYDFLNTSTSRLKRKAAAAALAKAGRKPV